MKHLKEILVSAVALMVIAGVVTAALAGTNALTAGVIAERAEAVEKAALQEVMEAERFEKEYLPETQQAYYCAYAEGQPVGYVFTTVAVGKSSGLTVMTGVSADGKITGVKVTEDNETAGYVAKVQKAGYLDAFVGQEAQPVTLGVQVDAVSQATKTSKGICDAVNQAIAAYQIIQGGDSNGE